MVASPAAAQSPVQSQSPLVEIFTELAEKSCKVKWEIDGKSIETSGSFITRYQGEVEVLTCFHDLSWEKAEKITVLYQSNVLEAKLATDVNPEWAACCDLTILNLSKQLVLPSFPLGGVIETAKRGEAIFFSGYPLGEESPTTQKGYICGVEGGFGNFKIDGTVLKGHSGGPVVRKNAEGLEIVGVISSQFVDFSQAFMSLFKSSSFVDNFKTLDPSWSVGITPDELLETLADAFFANLSTGIANVRFASHHIIVTYPDPISQRDEITEIGPDSGAPKDKCSYVSNDADQSTTLPVGKNEHMYAGYSKDSPEAEWIHHIKGSKIPLFMEITGRQRSDLHGREKNIEDHEVERLLQYFDLLNWIRKKEKDIKEIESSIETNTKLYPAAKQSLMEQLKGEKKH